MFNAGVILQMTLPGVAFHRNTRKRLGLELQDYICVASDEHGTLVYRQIRDMPVRTRMDEHYIYLDEDSMGLLNASLHDKLFVWRADYSIDMP